MTCLENLSALHARRKESPWAERIASQLNYLQALPQMEKEADQEKISRAAAHVLNCAREEGVITRSAVLEAEAMLAEYQSVAKSYHSLCIAHAHIDMNWMWGYNETAVITRDTFRTMLNLMKEYPSFTYAQSQASMYEIIEKFCPEMLEEIKERIREGRWEVTAAEWVEPDHNLPDGESLTRQLLQSKKYLCKLLDIPAEELNTCFIPDTFGHNVNYPEILQAGGVKYMYHCRGFLGPHLYHFRAPSGKSVLTYQEYTWYNMPITTDIFEHVPDFCKQYGVDTFLNVYGVGDHGGGPSRRDIERILEYASWPLTPDIRFGTFKEFFRRMEQYQDQFAVIDHELNYLFNGCYTTQARIKMANRISQARINEAEALMASSALLTGKAADPNRLDASWRIILFNHFHDILPGSGIVETREYALGQFQEAMGHIGIVASGAAQQIADRIDTSAIPFDTAAAGTAEGSGVGYYQNDAMKYRFPATERGRGSVRAFTLFNATPYARRDISDITVWDYSGDLKHVQVTDTEGNDLPFTITECTQGYWGHEYVTLRVQASIPAYGYTTVILRPLPCTWSYHPSILDNNINPRSDNHLTQEPIVLDNGKIRAVFSRRNMALLSLTDLETGSEMVSAPSACFWLSHENTSQYLTAWRIGSFMTETNLNETNDTRLLWESRTALCQSFAYDMDFGQSRLHAEISLKKDSPMVEFSLRIDWDERPKPGQYMPNLTFRLPVSYQTTGKLACDVPYGHILRDCITTDVPCLTYMGLCSNEGKMAALLTDVKYGYTGYGQQASVTLLRSPYDPDPYPDRGIHEIRMGIAVADRDALPEISAQFNHPAYALPLTAHTGTLAATGSAISITGAMVSCVKPAEDGQGIAVRVYDVTGQSSQVCVKTAAKPIAAWLTNHNEQPLQALPISGDGTVTLPLEAFATATAVLHFA